MIAIPRKQHYRWLLLPFVVLVVFLVTTIVAVFVAEKFNIWRQPFVGFVSACAVVVAAYYVAPSGKFTTAVVVFVLGAIVATIVIGESYYPEHYPEPYSPTYLPLVVTYCGGLVALGFVRIVKHFGAANR